MEEKHVHSLEKIETELSGLKSSIRDSYKKVKCSNEKEQEILYKNFDKIINSLNEINKESFKLDDMLIWESILTSTDQGNIDELERKTYDEFIFAAQIARGKEKKIKAFKDNLEVAKVNNNGLIAGNDIEMEM